MTRIALVFPTGSDPRSPYLALPSLAAHLRRSGIAVSMHDLDIGGLRALVGPQLPPAIRALQARGRAARRDPVLARLLGMSEALPERAATALAVFDDPHRFFEPPEFAAARNTLLDCLDVHGAARRGRVRYSISPVAYDVVGVDPQRVDDLLRATRDDRFNLFAAYWEEAVFPALAAEDPLAVGITITNRQQVIPGLTLARRLRERGHFVVLGGALYTKFVAQLQRLPAFFDVFADAVVAYEGETALVELAGALESGRDFARVPNLLYRHGDQVRVNRTHVEDVERLPCPDFDGLPLGSYLTPVPVLPTYLGKGCYFNRCKFCDIPYINHVSRKVYRLRSPEKVAGDLRELNRRFGCRHFELTDEALPPRTLAQLADLLDRERDLSVNFVGYARLERGFTAELCRTLARVGMRKLFFGLESGSQQTLDHMDKGIDLGDVPAILGNCARAGIHFHLFSIVGFPEETAALARETLRFFEAHRELIDAPGNSFDIHPFGLELRTAYAREAEPLGIRIDPGAIAKDFVVGPGTGWTNTRGLRHEEVDRLVAEFNDRLRRLYSRYHGGVDQLWPAFEEFAVLYGDHYRDREFPYRASLVDGDRLDRFRLRWNPATWIERRRDTSCFVRSRHGAAGLSAAGFELLDNALHRPVAELVEILCGDVKPERRAATRAAVLDVLNQWLAVHVLQLVPRAEATHAGAA
jgi:radical SAM superfamily enzyme YgiQ (UPF0313 family)